jgi:hypothetical protein
VLCEAAGCRAGCQDPEDKLVHITIWGDKRGWFTFMGVPAGRFEVAVEMIGYQSRADSITIQSGRTHDMEVRLSPKAVELPPLAVTVRSQWLEENGFYERKITIDTWDIIPLIAIEATEIYRGGGAPMMYNDNCGTILIWTKRGR